MRKSAFIGRLLLAAAAAGCTFALADPAHPDACELAKIDESNAATFAAAHPGEREWQILHQLMVDAREIVCAEER